MGFLDSLMSGSGGPPMEEAGFGAGGGGSNISSMQRQLSPLRAMRYLRQPFAHIGRGPNQGSGQNGPMPGMGGTDYSSYTFDPEARAQAQKQLAPYGQSPLSPDQVQNNTILPNSGFFGRHPRLSNAIESGMYGAAMTRGSDTWGEGISNVMQGLIGGQQAHRAAYDRQFQAPFEAASGMASLMDQSQKRDLQEAEIQHYRILNQKIQNTPDQKPSPVPATDSSYFTLDDKGNWVQKENPYFDPKAAATAKALGPNNHLAPYFKIANVDPAVASPADWKRANDAYIQDQSRISASRAAGADVGHGPLRDEQDQAKADLAKQNFLKIKHPPSFYMKNGMEPGDNAALATWYDNNIAGQEAPLLQKRSAMPGKPTTKSKTLVEQKDGSFKEQ